MSCKVHYQTFNKSKSARRVVTTGGTCKLWREKKNCDDKSYVIRIPHLWIPTSLARFVFALCVLQDAVQFEYRALWISMFAFVAQRSRRANGWDSGSGKKHFAGEGREVVVGWGRGGGQWANVGSRLSGLKKQDRLEAYGKNLAEMNELKALTIPDKSVRRRRRKKKGCRGWTSVARVCQCVQKVRGRLKLVG